MTLKGDDLMVSFIEVESVRCVLPGFALPLGKSGDYLVKYFKEKHGVDIEYLTQTKTLPADGPKGSRVDQIFNVEKHSLDKFADIRAQIGALYATEIIENNDQHLYNERVYLKFFQTTENELLKLGKISKEDVYQITE